jgi:hypothetical protein
VQVSKTLQLETLVQELHTRFDVRVHAVLSHVPGSHATLHKAHWSAVESTTELTLKYPASQVSHRELLTKVHVAAVKQFGIEGQVAHSRFVLGEHATLSY